MDFWKSFERQYGKLAEYTFEELALHLFRYQANNNPVYRQYLDYRQIVPDDIGTVEKIPFLPISLFKNHPIKTGEWSSTQIFESSGTTGGNTSKHHVRSLDGYLNNAREIFEHQYGSLHDYHFVALLPSYLERNNSSLVMMADFFIRESGSPYSGFYLEDIGRLAETLKVLHDDTARKTILIGVTFALLDLVEQYDVSLPEIIVIETGGMKGRRKEMIREEVHQLLKQGLKTHHIHSEYGMTELLSQAYSTSSGIFMENSKLRVLIRDINDPPSLLQNGMTGGVNIIDLNNSDTCAFIETQDLGRKPSDHTFEILGRFDNSDIRGCSLLTV